MSNSAQVNILQLVTHTGSTTTTATSARVENTQNNNSLATTHESMSFSSLLDSSHLDISESEVNDFSEFDLFLSKKESDSGSLFSGNEFPHEVESAMLLPENDKGVGKLDDEYGITLGDVLISVDGVSQKKDSTNEKGAIFLDETSFESKSGVVLKLKSGSLFSDNLGLNERGLNELGLNELGKDKLTLDKLAPEVVTSEKLKPEQLASQGLLLGKGVIKILDETDQFGIGEKLSPIKLTQLFRSLENEQASIGQLKNNHGTLANRSFAALSSEAALSLDEDQMNDKKLFMSNEEMLDKKVNKEMDIKLLANGETSTKGSFLMTSLNKVTELAGKLNENGLRQKAGLSHAVLTHEKSGGLESLHHVIRNAEPVLPAAQAMHPVVSAEFTQGLNLRQNFSTNLASRVQWIFNQALSSAEIMMDPPEMGPLTVKVQQVNGETNIMFHATNAATREALEEGMPKLKEMLEALNINLGEASVKQQNSGAESEGENSEEASEQLTDEGDEATDSSKHLVSEQLVDLYS